MRQTVFAVFIIALISLASCRTDFDFQPSVGHLAFSKDTVYLDTVFTDIGSSTYTLKVYNKTDDDISIPTIQLGKGLASKYRITVDGMTGNNGKIFNNVELLAKDSLYIFVETTANIADANPDDFLYTDQILFGNGTDFQKVELVTLIQDAIFLYPQKFEDGTTETLTLGSGENAQQIYGFYLDEDDPIHGNEYELTNDKPYVIYGYAGVANGKTLNIEAGARLHFHAESGIIVASGATLNINGAVSTTEALENEVIFEGDRLEPGFADVPGQWGLIWLTSGSTGTVNHLTLKNAIVGFLVENNAGEMSITNTQIYNNSVAGIFARNGTIKGENIVINNCGQACFAGTYGGKYNMTHCTFNNDWPSSGQSAVFLNNFITDADPESNPLTEANFNNCIIYGSNQRELDLRKYDDVQTFNYKFDHCLIRFNNVDNEYTDDPLYQFDTDAYSGSLIAKTSLQFDPKFFDADNNKLNISPESAAFQVGNPLFVVPVDVLGNQRTSTPPDLGAYQSAVFPEEN